MMKNYSIHINQLGYSTKGKKVAVVVNHRGGLTVKETGTNRIVYKGDSTGFGLDEASLDDVSHFDFSALIQEGNYYIEADECGKSHSFTIADTVYSSVKNALLKGLYYQRCGIELKEEYAGEYKHGICHTGKARVYNNPDIELEVTGGWHDAGDYGRYATAGAVSVADILLSYELFGEVYTDDIHIPESGNGIPDVLDEARVELEWLLKVQNQATGGVYHKVTTKHFCGMIMPEEEHETLYLMPESAVAAGDFAAVMAMAYRIYKDIDEVFADTMLLAAKKAWIWLKNNPNIPGFKNPMDVGTGEYGDPHSEDERYWAAVELYRATGDTEYHNYIREILKTDVDLISLGWASVGGYASFSYVRMVQVQERSGEPDIAKYLKETLVEQIETNLSIAKKDGYLVNILPKQYRWGSNMTILNGAQLLILGYFLTEKEEYYQKALDQLHYILGRNPLGISYITGVGTDSVNQIHHRPSAADNIKEAVPGLLSGGPNHYLNDAVAKALIPSGTAPAKCFIDHVESYSTNEIAIYWNTPAIFVAAFCDYMSGL